MYGMETERENTAEFVITHMLRAEYIFGEDALIHISYTPIPYRIMNKKKSPFFNQMFGRGNLGKAALPSPHWVRISQ